MQRLDFKLLLFFEEGINPGFALKLLPLFQEAIFALLALGMADPEEKKVMVVVVMANEVMEVVAAAK